MHEKKTAKPQRTALPRAAKLLLESALESLRASEARFRSVIEQAPEYGLRRP